MNFRTFETRSAVSALMFLVSASLFAQTPALPPTVVTASRTEQPLADVLPSVSVLTRADIERTQAASLADLLQGEAGFEFGRNGGPGTVTSFFLRGADSKNLVVMIDGVRTLADGWGNLTAIDIPLSQIERIELLRGNASALYGEAAVGGVLQIFTRRAQGQGPDGALTVGSRNSQSLQAGYSLQQQSTHWRVDLGRERTDGFSAMDPRQSGKVNPDANGMDASQAALRADTRLSADTRAGAYVSNLRTSVAYDSNLGLASDTYLLRRESSLVNAYWQTRVSPDWTSRVDFSRNVFELNDIKNGVANRTAFDSGLLQGAQNSARWFNTWAAGRELLLNFGADASNESFAADALSSAYQANRVLRGYFAGLNQTLGAWSLQANARYDDVRVFKLDSASDKTWSNSSLLLGAAYRLAAPWRLTGSVSSGFRAPSAGELSNNIDLKPETHVSQELGVTYAQGADSARLVVFDTRTTDAIYWQNVAPFTPVNVGKVRNQGAEFTARTQWRGQQFKLALVTQDPWNETEGTRLARRARNYGSFESWRNFGPNLAGIKLYMSDDRYEPNATDRLLAGYSVLSLYASRALSPEWTARIKADNVLDRPYQLAYGYNTAPSGVFLTLAYRPR